MKKILMTSHLASINPNSPAFKLDANSIILVEPDGLEIVVGQSAFTLSPEGGRIFGGGPTDRHYQRLVRALIAKGLGEGEHEITIGLSAAKQYVMEFRAGKSTIALKDEGVNSLAEALKEINFKVGSSESPIKTCRVTLVPNKDVPVLYETEAVTEVMPKQANSYLLFQIGSGDWQSVVVVDRKIVHSTQSRVQGIAGAEAKLAELLGLSVVETKKAWLTGTRPNGDLESKPVSCQIEKTRAARAHISENLPKLLNSMDGYKDRLGALVISGGAVKDPAFIKELIAEIPGSITAFTIDNPNLGTIDPVFACAEGIYAQKVSCALDIGNSYLKGIFDND
jgi:hypothetical protein